MFVLGKRSVNRPNKSAEKHASELAEENK